MKRKAIFLTDLMLIPLFLLTLYTGVELHIAGHTMNHVVWHNWAIFHTIVGLLFAITSAIHIKAHWGWYKGLKRGWRNKSKITCGLSCAFVVAVLSGMVLLCINGADSSVGLLHYIAGIITSVGVILHLFKRFTLLKNVIRV